MIANASSQEAPLQPAFGAVLDASSLIIAAKLQAIDSLQQVYGRLAITPAVFAEAVQGGKQRSKSDALVMEVAIRADVIGVVSLTEAQECFAQQLHADGALGLGECEALAYARGTGVRLIIEERKSKTVARVYSINYIVLQVFPLHGYIEGKIAYASCVDLLDRIAVAMNTDLAILTALRAAAKAIRSER